MRTRGALDTIGAWKPPILTPFLKSINSSAALRLVKSASKKKSINLEDEMMAQNADLCAARKLCDDKTWHKHLEAAGLSQLQAWRYMALTKAFVTNDQAAPIAVFARRYILNAGRPVHRETAVALANAGVPVDEEKAHQIVAKGHTCGGLAAGAPTCPVCKKRKLKDSLSQPQFKLKAKAHQTELPVTVCPVCKGQGHYSADDVKLHQFNPHAMLSTKREEVLKALVVVIEKGYDLADPFSRLILSLDSKSLGLLMGIFEATLETLPPKP